MKFLFAALLTGLAVVPLNSGAIDADEPLADPAQQALYKNLTEEVRCLVCQNQALADSTAPLAADLRREIRDMVVAGKNATEIKTFLTDRYGDFVLYKPRYTGPSVLLWLAPAIFVVIGGVGLWRIVRRRRALPVGSEDEDEAAARADSAWE